MKSRGSEHFYGFFFRVHRLLLRPHLLASNMDIIRSFVSSRDGKAFSHQRFIFVSSRGKDDGNAMRTTKELFRLGRHNFFFFFMRNVVKNELWCQPRSPELEFMWICIACGVATSDDVVGYWHQPLLLLRTTATERRAHTRDIMHTNRIRHHTNAIYIYGWKIHLNLFDYLFICFRLKLLFIQFDAWCSRFSKRNGPTTFFGCCRRFISVVRWCRRHGANGWMVHACAPLLVLYFEPQIFAFFHDSSRTCLILQLDLVATAAAKATTVAVAVIKAMTTAFSPS